MTHTAATRRRLPAMGASLAVHAALFGALFYAVSAVPPVIRLEEQMIVVSLAHFAPARPAESAATEKRTVAAAAPVTPPAAETPKPVPPVSKPLPEKEAPRPVQTAPVAAEAPAPLPAAAETIPPETPEIKEAPVETAPLSEALASPPSQTVTSAVSTDSPPTPKTGMDEPSSVPTQKADPKGVDATVLGRIRTMIEQAVTYPSIARRLRLEGVVVLSFMLKPDGAVAEAEVIKSSGSAVLDREALNSLWDLSGDFPSLESLTKLTIPITFSLTHS